MLADADFSAFAAGHTFARPGEPVSFAFFPDAGVVSIVGEMMSGQRFGVRVIGVDGFVGFEPLVGVPRHAQRLIVLLDAVGYRVPVDRLKRVFEHSDALRRILLTHLGHTMSQLVTTAVCGRAHTQRQRLARWLLLIADTATQQTLPLTHEAIAGIVGGPRHAVTVALNELAQKGAIGHLRGRVEILNRSILIAEACECYTIDARQQIE